MPTTETEKSIFRNFSVRVNNKFLSFSMKIKHKRRFIPLLQARTADLHRTLSLLTYISVQGLVVAPGSCWHTLGAGVEGFASSANRPAWRGGHSTTAGGVLRPT